MPAAQVHGDEHCQYVDSLMLYSMSTQQLRPDSHLCYALAVRRCQPDGAHDGVTLELVDPWRSSL